MQKNLLFFTVLALVLATGSYGYIDAGTGSYVLQFAIAGIVGVFFSVKGYSKTVKIKMISFVNKLFYFRHHKLKVK